LNFSGTRLQVAKCNSSSLPLPARESFRSFLLLRARSQLSTLNPQPFQPCVFSLINASRSSNWLIIQHQMKSLSAASILCFTLVASMHGQQSPTERVTEIQAALREAKLDGWLFYDFRHSDPLAYRILKLDEKMFASRRWF